MSVIVFDKGDEPYLQWMKDHPHGFVLNTASGVSTWFLMFHHANCPHISGYTKSQEKGAFTQRNYVKACSDDPSNLIAWAASQRKGVTEYQECKTCKPDIELVVPALPEEAGATSTHIEGAVRSVTVNSYERNPLARKACLDHYGYSCSVCDFNFEAVYGQLGKEFIHVHHLIPLSEIKKTYSINPVSDLRPVCPNCHAMIHLGGVTRTIEEVRKMILEKNLTSK